MECLLSAPALACLCIRLFLLDVAGGCSGTPSPRLAPTRGLDFGTAHLSNRLSYTQAGEETANIIGSIY